MCELQHLGNSDQVVVMERKARSLGRGIGSGAFGYTCRFYLGSPDVTSSRQLPEPHPSTRVERVHPGWSSAPQRHYIDTTLTPQLCYLLTLHGVGNWRIPTLLTSLYQCEYLPLHPSDPPLTTIPASSWSAYSFRTSHNM
jgi:hypothetical protein